MKQTARLKQLRTRFPDLEFQDYYCASIDAFVESARCCPKKDMARCLVSYVLGRAFEDMSMTAVVLCPDQQSRGLDDPNEEE